MVINTSLDISKDISKIIEQSLQNEIEKEFDFVLKNFERRKGEIVAGILISIKRTTDMRILEDRIIFEIKSIT